MTAPLGAQYTYSIDGTNFQASPAFNNVTPSGYTLTVQNTAGCTSTATVTVNAGATAPATPTITSTAASCVADGTSTISNYDNTLTSTFTPAGPAVGAGGVITWMTSGTNYTVTATNAGGCTSAVSPQFVNAAQTPAPAVPTVTSTAASCAADGTSTITNYDNTLTYTFTPQQAQRREQAGVITGMTVGTSYTVTASAGAMWCSAHASAAFLNAAQLAVPATPTATTVDGTCAVPTGTITVTAPLGAQYTYSIDGTNFQASPAFNKCNSERIYTDCSEHRRMYVNGHCYG